MYKCVSYFHKISVIYWVDSISTSPEKENLDVCGWFSLSRSIHFRSVVCFFFLQGYRRALLTFFVTLIWQSFNSLRIFFLAKQSLWIILWLLTQLEAFIALYCNRWTQKRCLFKVDKFTKYHSVHTIMLLIYRHMSRVLPCLVYPTDNIYIANSISTWIVFYI